MNSVTRDMKYKRPIMKWALCWGAAGKFNKSPSYIYFWRDRYDETIESLAKRSRRPHPHLNQHTEADIEPICDMRRRNLTLSYLSLGFG